jgi:penicillin-binding protein 2
MGGVLYRPHVAITEKLPSQFRTVALKDQDVVRVPLSVQNWITITDAMSRVLLPGGTAPSAHLEGVDFAGKTGSAQVISNTLRKSSADLNDNGWFVGVAPRRNPEIVVCVLFQGGEHGKLAGRLAAQVIKAYVEKQRRLRNNPTLFSDKVDPGSVPVASLWHDADSSNGSPAGAAGHDTENHLQGGTMMVKVPRLRKDFVTSSSRALSAVLPGVN